MSYLIDTILFTGSKIDWPTSDIPLMVVSNGFLCFTAILTYLRSLSFLIATILFAGSKMAWPTSATPVMVVSNGFF